MKLDGKRCRYHCCVRHGRLEMALVRSQHDTTNSQCVLLAYVVLPVDLLLVLVPVLALVLVLEPVLALVLALVPVLVLALALEPVLVLAPVLVLVLEPAWELVQAQVLVSHLRMPPVMAL